MKNEELSEAIQRLDASESKLKNLGFEVHQGLPLYPLSSEIHPRSAKEAAIRAMCLTLLAAKGEGLELKVTQHVIQIFGLEPFFSEKEWAFLQSVKPSDKDRIYFAWKYESVCVLWWYIGFWNTLDFPEDICDGAKVVETMLTYQNSDNLIQAVNPVSVQKLLDEADFNFRCLGSLEWAILNESTYPKVNKDVLIERFFTFQWLMNPVHWDEVQSIHFEV